VADGEDTAVVSRENVELAMRISEKIASGDFVEALGDEESLEAKRAAVDPLVEPDFEVEMIAPDYAAAEPLVGRGIDGYVKVWREWLAPYESYTAELEAYHDAGDRVVMFVRQVGRPRLGSVPVEAESAVVFTFRAGKLARLEFHLERESAMRAAGLAD
jgi:ketosteroid isomerase-like protein